MGLASYEYIEFYNILKVMKDKEYIENILVYNLSPVIAGIKPASTITFKRNGDNSYDKWIRYGRGFIDDMDLKWLEIKSYNNVVIILIYNKYLLKEYLYKEDNKNLLIQIGYSEAKNIYEILNVLKDRYSKCDCPHELGLFLGIPIKDVNDFMSSNKKCLFCGYWKVYNDVEGAKKIFNKYDEIKEKIIIFILKGERGMDLVGKVKYKYF
ncbi:DUF3793 family protein [Clostridium paraputrificum]|uniref:DUF3793 family protein n=1 Tax=Clostridium paraputrificum TaxID=29363 RepID=UPI003D334CE0